METLKFVVVLGVIAIAVSLGLAHLLAAVTGGSVTRDEMVRIAISSFVVVAAVVSLLRRRQSSGTD